MKNRVLIAVGLLLILVCFGYLTIGYLTENVLSYSAIRPYRLTTQDIQNLYGDFLNPGSVGIKWVEHDITVEDTIHLRGWFVYSAVIPSQGTIFLLHGIGSSRVAMIPVAKTLTANGFNCVLYDSRANGESGGINCTFGFYEKRDLSAYMDSTISRFPFSGPYAVFGSSLGAAVSIQAMAEDKRLVCGIAESPFANLRDVIHDYFARMFHIRINSIPDRALIFTERIGHFSVDSVQPAQSAKRITQPLMIVHGLQDKNINPSYGRQVYDNLSSLKKVWYPIPMGDHNNLGKIGGVEYRGRIVKFYKDNLLSGKENNK